MGALRLIGEIGNSLFDGVDWGTLRLMWKIGNASLDWQDG